MGLRQRIVTEIYDGITNALPLIIGKINEFTENF